MSEPSEPAQRIAKALCCFFYPRGTDNFAMVISESGLAELEGKHAHLETVLDQSRKHRDELEARLEAAERDLLVAKETYRVHVESNNPPPHDKTKACRLCEVERERDEARGRLRTINTLSVDPANLRKIHHLATEAEGGEDG
jgi:hypothetical protein